jgi:putative flippase GtrA
MTISVTQWWHLPQKLRFLAAGAYNTAFGYAVFATLYWFLGERLNYLVIGLASYIISVVSAYAIYRLLVFRALDSVPASFFRFNLSQVTALGCGMFGLYLLVQVFHVHPLVAQACVLILSVGVTFVLHSKFSFRNHLG